MTLSLAPRPGLDQALLEELAVRASRIKQAVREHQAERRQALKELQNELDA